MMRGMLSSIQRCSIGLTISATISSSDRPPVIAAGRDPPDCMSDGAEAAAGGAATSSGTGGLAITTGPDATGGAELFEAARPAARASSAWFPVDVLAAVGGGRAVAAAVSLLVAAFAVLNAAPERGGGTTADGAAFACGATSGRENIVDRGGSGTLGAAGAPLAGGELVDAGAAEAVTSVFAGDAGAAGIAAITTGPVFAGGTAGENDGSAAGTGVCGSLFAAVSKRGDGP
jgi:hypothetical protein